MTTEGSNPTATKIRRLVSRCSVCKAALSGHRFAEIASTVATEANKSNVQKLLKHVKEHQWSALLGYRDFQADQNTVIVYLIAGPHTGGMVVLIRDPVELYEGAELYLQEQLDTDELEAIVTLIPAENWKDL
jgi:hypothetical protein